MRDFSESIREGCEASVRPPDLSAAFLETIEKRRPVLIRTAYRTTKNMEEAEDIVQEAILKAYSALQGFRGESSVDTWLRAIVVNTARNWSRSRRTEPPLLPTGQSQYGDEERILHEIADTRKNPEQWCEFHELEEKLNAAVDELRVPLQTVIRMCVLGGHSYREASAKLDVSVVIVKARIFRGREILRRTLRPDIPEQPRNSPSV